MRIRTLDELGDVSGQRAFVRVDYNVPLKGGVVTDNARIRASLPTITELIDAGASIVLASHLGRPKGRVVEELRMTPVADRLAEILGREVLPLDEVVGENVEAACAHLAPGEVAMLENLRFEPGEERNDRAFAERLAALAEVYVDDAFGAVHRAHASVVALPELLLERGSPAAAGRLLQREVESLSRLLRDPARPYVAVLGGAKVSDKLGTIAAPEVSADARRQTVLASSVPRGLRGLDIGPRTVEEFARPIADAKTILWNGPMGVFELEPFGAGTRGVATAIAGASAYSVAGGGDSLAAIAKYGLEDGFDHLSTGGGASLEFLEGRSLPGISVLETEQP